MWHSPGRNTSAAVSRLGREGWIKKRISETNTTQPEETKKQTNTKGTNKNSGTNGNKELTREQTELDKQRNKQTLKKHTKEQI